MRIVLVDDVAVQVEEIKRAVQRAGLNISEQDCLHLPTSAKTEVQQALLERLQACPAPTRFGSLLRLAGNQQELVDATHHRPRLSYLQRRLRRIRKQQDHQHL